MKPKISIVIAAYNEERLLSKCLESLNAQSYPGEQYEIIVVDNGSQDKTSEIAKKFGSTVYLFTDVQGCGPTRRFGVSKAKAEIVAITDADCFLPENWLLMIEKAFDDQSLVCIGGKGVPKNKTLMSNLIFGFYNKFHILNHKFGKRILWGYNMAFRKTAYNAVGGFDPFLLSSDDWDLAFRLADKFGNKSVKYIPDLIAYSYGRKETDSKAFLRYAFNGIINYTLFVILGKKKAIPVFNVR